MSPILAMLVGLAGIPAFFVVLTDGLVGVPPSKWTAIQVKVRENSTTVDCMFNVREGGSRVQAILLTREQADRFHRGRSITPIFSSGFEKSTRFRHLVREAGDYVLILDNRLEGRTPAQVELRLELTSPRNIQVRELPPARRHAVVALSLLFFGSTVAYTAWQFLRNTSR